MDPNANLSCLSPEQYTNLERKIPVDKLIGCIAAWTGPFSNKILDSHVLQQVENKKSRVSYVQVTF